jgi:phage shock protein A
MFKTLITIIRGKNFETIERVADAHALTILDQQIRDATANLDRARRALAIAIAQDASETKRVEAVRTRIADLEARAVAALNGGREDLATEAAETIANLENDLMSATAAQTSFARECAKLKAMTANGERRLIELERGRRAARAAEAVRRLRSNGEEHLGGGASALQDAEATLKRLRARQLEDEAATQAIEAMEGVNGADLVSEKLEAAGFGDATRPSAKSVLERLRQRQQAAV